LEVILTHLSDPDEKELVKTELTKRYYEHYLSLGRDSGEDTPTAAFPDSETDGLAAAEPGGLTPETAPLPEDAVGEEFAEDIARLEAVEPIRVDPGKYKDTAAKAANDRERPKIPPKKYCFIATAAYGTPLAQEVITLQSFRDTYLSHTRLGEKFIRIYYHCSPCLAETIRRHHLLRLATQVLLAPLIFLIKTTCGISGRR